MIWRRLVLAGLIGACCAVLWAGFRPADAAPGPDVPQLRDVLAKLLGNPPVLRVSAIPGPRNGTFGQIEAYAEHGAIQGLRIDQLWFRLVGAALDPGQLRQGTLDVVSVQRTAIYGTVALGSIEDMLNQERTVRDVKLSNDGDATVAEGTIVYGALPVPTHVRMRGTFAVTGVPEIFFHVQDVAIDGLPMPGSMAQQVEQQINPVVDLRAWPVSFPIRTFHPTDTGFILSSQADLSQPCDACVGAPVQPKP